MRRLSSFPAGAGLAALILFAGTAGAQAPTTPPAAGPIKPAAIPPAQEATLPNGLRVLLIESHRQPVVSLALMLPAGDSYDPAGKEGLATMVAGLITKGAGSRTADQVSAAIEGVGGTIAAAADPDFLTVRADVLAENAPLAFELVADAVARPTFAESEVELLRTQTLSGLQLELSQPAQLAERFFFARLYGAHPYAKRPTPASVRAIATANLKDFQRSRLVPGGAMLVVAGDITLPQATQLARQHFSAWTGKAPAAVARPRPAARTRTEIVLVHRPGSVQSNIVVGNLTTTPADPQLQALTVANKVLGGGTDARLFMTLRETKSWTYGAYSQLERFRDVGALVATAEVRTPVTDSALTELLSIERSLAATAVTPAELEAAKSALVGRLPLQIETAQQVAEQVGRNTMLGLPKTYLTTLRPRLAAVTAPQLQAAARTYIRPGQALIVVVGDGALVYDKLAKIAPTTIITAQGDPLTPADLAPRTASLPVDVRQLVARADSFTVLVQGNPMGFQTSSLARSGDGFTYTTVTQLGPVMQQTVKTTFGENLAPRSVKANGAVQGMTLATDLTYAAGRVKGSSTSPTPQGLKTVAVDTTVDADVVDDNMIGALVPGLKWAPGAKFTASAFDASANAVRQLTLNVAGTESVTVPAGTFETYRVDLAGGQAPLTLYVTTAAPYRVVKLAPAGAPIEFVLAK